MGSQVVHIIHYFELYLNSRNLILELGAFHVNHHLKLFIESYGHNPISFMSSRTLSC